MKKVIVIIILAAVVSMSIAPIGIPNILQPQSTISYGSKCTFNSDSSALYTSTSSLDATHFVVAYFSGADSFSGDACIGTVNGNAVSFGNEYEYETTVEVMQPTVSVSALNSTYFVIAYNDGETTGTCIIGKVSGSTISYGSEYSFITDTVNYVSVSALDNTHFVVTYSIAAGSSAGIIGVVSNGDEIAYGAKNTFSNGSTSYNSYNSVSALNSTYFVVAYSDDSQSNCTIGTVASGNVISYGSDYVFYALASESISVSSFNSTHFVVVYAGDTKGKSHIGNVSGNTISYDSECTFNDASTHGNSVSTLNTTDFVVVYTDSGNNDYGTGINGTVSGASTSYGSEVVFNSGWTEYTSVSALSNTHFAVAYNDADSNDGVGIIGSLPQPQSNTPPTQSDQKIWNNITGIEKSLNATDVSLNPTCFNVTVADIDADYMNVTIKTNESGTWTTVNATASGMTNGTYHGYNTSWIDAYSTTYYVSFNVSDDSEWCNETYHFTTTGAPPPTQSAHKIWNSTTSTEKFLNATGVSLTPTCFNVTVADIDADYMNVTIMSNESGVWQVVNQTSSGMLNGTYHAYNTSWIDAYSTTYYVSFNVTDDSAWCNETYHFMTVAAQEDLDEYPSNNSTDISRPPVNLSVYVTNPSSVDIYFYNMTPIADKWTLLQHWESTSGRVNVTDLTNWETDFIWGNTTYQWAVNVSGANNTYNYTTMQLANGANARYDVSNDDWVDGTDLLNDYAHRTGETSYYGIYDVNTDDWVDGTDLLQIYANRS